MYSAKQFIRNISLPLLSTLTLATGMASQAHAATLGERAIYRMEILADGVSCFTFGNCTTAPPGANSYLIDNDNNAATAGIGSSIAGDGLAGYMTIHTTGTPAGGVTFSVSAFNMDSYVGTAGGYFNTRAVNPASMSGSVAANGNILLNVTGRTGIAQFFVDSLGEQPWNTGATFTSGNQVNAVANLTGTALQNDLTAVLVSANLVGPSWGFFDGTPYTEVFSVRFVLQSAQPVAKPDTLAGSENSPLVINIAADLLANDVHAQGQHLLSLLNFSQPVQAGATVVSNNDGTLTYTPATGFVGTDSFTYTLDNTGPGTATVTINVAEGSNTPPVANDLAASTDEGVALVVNPASNDTDADGDTLTIDSFDAASAQGGTVTDNGDGTLTYTPPVGFSGNDSFGYSVSDGRGGAASAQVLITVVGEDLALTCADVPGFTTPLNTELLIDATDDLLSTCANAQGPVVLDSVTQPVNGTLAFDGLNTLTYTPNANFIGMDSFTYVAADDEGIDIPRTVNISVGKIYGNFTMLTPEGKTFGGTNDVVVGWDGTFNASEADTNFNMTFGSDLNFPFFGFVWSAHHIRVFGPGSYAFDTTCARAQIESGIAACGGTPDQYLALTVGEGQIGAHALFDWNKSVDIDVVLLWDMDGVFDNPVPGGELFQGPAGPTPALTAVYEFVSRDVNGNGVPGSQMIDGPFIDYSANFNLNFTRSSEGGEAGTVVSTIGKPSLGGGCVMRADAGSAQNRVDLLLVAGLIAWLGYLTARRRRHTLH